MASASLDRSPDRWSAPARFRSGGCFAPSDYAPRGCRRYAPMLEFVRNDLMGVVDGTTFFSRC